ncbi:MAG: tRNA pseudouridine(13) synthase TruD [Nitrososphaeraceae archaeon]|jgi:tRNA pseudouridine13 synthase
MTVPLIDQQAGIKHYCTTFSGIGGKIKQNPEDFQVREILNEQYLENVAKNSNSIHRFPVFILKKHNIDSNHAIIEIRNQLRLELRVLGIKDAKASTMQYATTTHIARNLPTRTKTHHTEICLIGYGGTLLSKSDLWGNQFSILIVETQHADLTDFLPEIDKIANFYGLQRFGSERMVTHTVGREILKGNFRRASELLLTETTKYDTAYSREIREQLSDPGNYNKLMGVLPKGMDIEREIVRSLLNKRDYVRAIRAIPIGIRRLYVQAYQAYIFNLCISESLSCGEDITKCRDGDLCFEIEGKDVLGKIRKLNPSVDTSSKVLPALRLVGYSFQAGKGRFESTSQEILKEEGLTPKDFYIRDMQELSAKGGFRQSVLWCKEFIHSGSLHVSFKLPKGSYATTLLREIMKPNSPIESGF